MAGTGAVAAKPAPRIKLFAQVRPVPGFPEGVVIDGNRVYVSGPARFGTAGTGPSVIRVYDRRTRVKLDTIAVAGEDLSQEHALSNIALDSAGRLYAASTQLGLIRFTKTGNTTWVQSAYGAPLPSFFGAPPIANDVVFDPAGNAYVSDSLQATIFRYAPGGGEPQVWFQSPLFAGGGPIPFGTNGLRIDPKRKQLYVAVSTYAGDPTHGTIYRLPLVEAPTAEQLEVFHVYDQSELPDQLAFGAKGDLYVSLAMTNQISVLRPDGTERRRISSQPGDSVPLDAPAGIAFDKASKTLLIVNHALLTANPDHFAVLQVNVGDKGNPLVKPVLP
jgi:sugar lactone lactonase YvrE